MTGPVFVDSNIWLYAILEGDDPMKTQKARELLDQSLLFVLSEQVIAEVSANFLRKSGRGEDELCELVQGFYERFQIIAPKHQTHIAASQLRRKYCLSYWDSLIVAAAQQAECEILYSEDMQHGLRIGALQILNPLL